MTTCGGTVSRMDCPALDSVKRHGIVTRDAQGRVWFAATRGLSVTDPARAKGRELPAVTLVEQLTVDGASIDIRGLLRIPSSRHSLDASPSVTPE